MLRHIIMLFISGLCVRSELLNLEIGPPCIRDGIPGQCVNIYECLSSYLDFQEKDNAPICSFEGNEPIICCTDCELNNTRGQVKYIALGILKRSDPDDLWQIYNVKRRIPHPEYKPPSKYHDIALLETDTEISFSRAMLPICLHSTEETEDYLTATGWGSLGPKRGLADSLQTVNVERFEEADCSKLYPTHRHLLEGYNHTTQMCYGDKSKPKDTCEGDSGGPLQTINVCQYYVAGVTSHGRQCGIAAGSGIYTRVIHYVPWIESVVWP